MRLAMLYALLDESQVVRLAHLKAALALWRYAEDSVRFIFGDILGDPVADTILRALRLHVTGMAETEITAEVVGRNMKAAVKNRALDLLREHHLARAEMRTDTGGRPERRWFAVMTA